MSQGKITAKQQEILAFIKETILNKGYPPTVREICEAVRLKSTSSVHSHLETLEHNGYIQGDNYLQRNFHEKFYIVSVSMNTSAQGRPSLLQCITFQSLLFLINFLGI